MLQITIEERHINFRLESNMMLYYIMGAVLGIIIIGGLALNYWNPLPEHNQIIVGLLTGLVVALLSDRAFPTIKKYLKKNRRVIGLLIVIIGALISSTSGNFPNTELSISLSSFALLLIGIGLMFYE